MSSAPSGETAAQLELERYLLNGVTLSAVAYGVVVVYTGKTIQMLCNPSHGRPSLPFLTYVICVFVLCTLALASNMRFNQEAYVDNRDYLGGPAAYLSDNFADPVGLLNAIVFGILSWLADGLVLYRYLQVWNHKWWMSILPVLMFLGSVASSIALLHALTHSSDTFFGLQAVQLGIAYWTLSISLNIILTVFIVGRILHMRNSVRKFSAVKHDDQYTGIAAILVESAALYSIWGLMFLIMYARDYPAQHLILPTLGIVEGLAPLLIIHRVAEGRAWSASTPEDLHISFTSGIDNTWSTTSRTTTTANNTSSGVSHRHRGTYPPTTDKKDPTQDFDIDIEKRASQERVVQEL